MDTGSGRSSRYGRCGLFTQRRYGSGRHGRGTSGYFRVAMQRWLRHLLLRLCRRWLRRLVRIQITERATGHAENYRGDIPYPSALRRGFRFLYETRAWGRPRNLRNRAGPGERKRYGSEGLLGMPVAAYEKVRDSVSHAAGFDQQDHVPGIREMRAQ